VSEYHPTYHKAPAALRWPEDGDLAKLWDLLNRAVHQVERDVWVARVLSTGTIVTVRVVGATREVRIQAPTMPRAESLARTAHCRWANEIDALRTAFGIRGWDKLETDGESVHYVDRPRAAAPAPQAYVAVAPTAPAAARPRLRSRTVQIGLVLEEVAS
jgi:hypothetical protein